MAERNERPMVNMRPGGGGGRGPGGPRGMMTREKPKNMGKTVKKLIAYIGSGKYLVISLLIIMLFTTVMNLAGPALQGSAIDAIGNGDMGGLVVILGAMAAIYLLSSALTYFQGIAAAKLSQRTVYQMRSDLFGKIEYLPIKFTDTHQHGDIMSRMTNDVENVSNTISTSIASLFSGVITLIGSFAMMLYYSPIITLIAMVTIPLTILASTFMSKFMRRYFVEQQMLLGNLNGHIEEMVTGYKTVMAYGKEGKSTAEFAEISANLRKTGIKANIFGGVMGPLMNVIGNFGYLLIVVSGGYFALKGVITVGIILSFIQYSKQFTRPINELANQYAQILTAIAGAERVFEIMDDQAVESSEIAEDIDVGQVKGDLSFENVMFSYKPGEPVLKDFNLKVEAGQQIAIVGKTGSGKTTVVNLLTRFYDIDSGCIKLDGRDIRTISKRSLRKSIAIVLQDTVLFSDTIGANISYGKLNASREEIKAAAACANADVFIDRLPEGYDTELTGSGSNLSQGQRQLLSIARAVLADPKILILDEATSSVDTRTEMQIQQAMLALMKGRTSLVIAHRLSTIRDSDMIIVLDDGHIVEAGNHEELLKLGGAYYNLYQTQFAGFAT